MREGYGRVEIDAHSAVLSAFLGDQKSKEIVGDFQVRGFINSSDGLRNMGHAGRHKAPPYQSLQYRTWPRF